MDMFVITGGATLQGEVDIGGAKNASLPALAACLLAEGESSIGNVPFLKDVETLIRILNRLGMKARRDSEGRVVCLVENEDECTAPYELVKTMRASICVLGPLVAKRGRAKVSLPGGCVIGPRPIDLHLKGLEALGATIRVEHGYVIVEAERLTGTRVYLGGPNGPTVLGTLTVMMAATLADGETVIEHAACEPEIEDLAKLLVSMGASIDGAGTHRIRVRGVRRLTGVRHDIVPDRIEAATFLMAGAITGGEILCRNARSEHLDAVLDRLADANVVIKEEPAGLRVLAGAQPKRTDVTTLPYPGFPTDVQAQMTALLCLAEGESMVTDRVFPDRFIHTAELNRMGAKIARDGGSITVHGVDKLEGAEVMASDLRASAALVLAALAANGETEIHRIYHLDRGYEKLEWKLQRLGADIRRESD
jgi:UDP-N-acetylglucosamine 1-carboxyvinyltransferase